MAVTDSRPGAVVQLQLPLTIPPGPSQRPAVSSSKGEQSRAEQSRAEQSRAEQSRAEQSRAEQSTHWCHALVAAYEGSCA
jgi:hypothetical protein